MYSGGLIKKKADSERRLELEGKSETRKQPRVKSCGGKIA